MFIPLRVTVKFDPLTPNLTRSSLSLEGEGKVKGRERERRWREGFGPPKNFGVAP